MQEEAKKILIRSSLFILLSGVALLTYYRFSFYLTGPELVSINLQRFEETDSAWKEVVIETKNTQSVRINSRLVPLENKTKARSILVFHPHENIIEVELSDRFKKTKTYLYHIYFKKELDTDIPKTLKEAKEQAKTLANIKTE